jgi:hypothetical protein
VLECEVVYELLAHVTAYEVLAHDSVCLATIFFSKTQVVLCDLLQFGLSLSAHVYYVTGQQIVRKGGREVEGER